MNRARRFSSAHSLCALLLLGVHCGGDASPADEADGVEGGRDGGGAGSSSGGSNRAGTSATGGRSGATSSGGVAGATATAGRAGSSSAGTAGTSGASGGAPGSAGDSGSIAGASGGGADAGGGGEAGDGNGHPGPWANCPTAADYPGDAAWPHALEVSDTAIYCATFSESRTLKEELAAKALLRIAPGRYPLPGANRPNIGLPICIQDGPDAAPVAVPAGELTYRSTTLGDVVSTSYSFDSPVSLGSPGRLQTRVQHDRAPGAPPTFVLDGATDDIADMEHYHTLLLCEGTSGCSTNRTFDSCTHAASRLNLHTVELDAGNVVLELRIGQSFAGTEPGAFVRAHGTFRGSAFDQRDYFRLVYNPAHHHFKRNFAVLFDAPIDGACGIEISGLEPGDTVPDAAYTVDCTLERIDALLVESHTLSQEAP